MPTIKFVYWKNVLDITENNTDSDIIGNAIKKYRKIIREEDLLFLYKGIKS